MKTSTLKSNLKTIKADAVAVFIYQDKNIFGEQISNLKKILPKEIDRIINLENFKSKQETTAFAYTDNIIASPRLILVGVGKQGKTTLETFRRASAAAANKAKSMKAKHIAIMFPHLPSGFSGTVEDTVQSIVEGSILSQYKFDKYITFKKEEHNNISEITIFADDEAKSKLISKGAKLARIVCDGVILARNLVNAPASEIYPETLAQAAKESSEKYGFKCSIWNEKKIKQEGFGGLMGVSSGSTRPPRFIILDYNSNNKELDTVVLVGKGITFDSGGISIKPSANMSEMKMDMSGAAAVIGTIETASRLKLPIHLVGLIPATENMPSGSAMKPGDIISHYGGKTSEVDNTDAEGRLILADALAYAHSFKPKCVIDLATLTGAVVVALGHHATAVLGNDDALISKLKVAGEKTYERVWQLPLFEEYEKQIKSDVADVKNIGNRGAGTITAAMFLKKFISTKNKKEYRWAHLDIAGTAIMDEGSHYIPKCGSGVGVRLLTEFFRNWKT
ncbi:MAG: leucyl aminopeptidase [Bacteroidota bacterium]|nr:leucyl aminopeptidase [Bacteroidota bacterium]